MEEASGPRRRRRRPTHAEAVLVELAAALTTDFTEEDLVRVLVAGSTHLTGVAHVLFRAVGPPWARHPDRSDDLGPEGLGPERPWTEAARRGEAVVGVEIGADPRWAGLAGCPSVSGHAVVHCIPISDRSRVTGVIVLLDDVVEPLDPADVAAVEALGTVVASVAGRTRALAEAHRTCGQLQHAFDSRVVIEQAKGVLSEQLGVDVGRAFEVLRGRSRRTNTPLADVAARVASHQLRLDQREDPPWPSHPRPIH